MRMCGAETCSSLNGCRRQLLHATLLLWLVLVSIQVPGTCAEKHDVDHNSEQSTDSRSLWESDIFFLQKLSSFFGGGGGDTKKKESPPVRRNERRPVKRPEMIPPQLFYPEGTTPAGGNLALVGHAMVPPGGNRGSKKQPPGRGRPGFHSKQKPYFRGQNIRKQGDKPPLRRRFPNGRPLPVRVQRPDVVFSNNFRRPPPIPNSYNEIHPNHHNINSIFTAPPTKFLQYPSRLPPVNHFSSILPHPIKEGFTPKINDDFTRTVSSSFVANNNVNSISDKVDAPDSLPNFAPPRDSSIVFPPNNEPGHPLDNSVLETSSSEKRLTRLKQFGIPGPNFGSIQLPQSPKIRRRIPEHPRPAPRPQRLQIGPTKPNSFEYNGGDDFLPSPKEGSMTDDAFQPIFRASQSLDVDLPPSFMKPMHVASARALPFVKPPPPPEVIDFFEGGGAKPI